jgi:transketolase
VPIADVLEEDGFPGAEPAPELVADLERFDVAFRSLASVLYNFVPTSGHPGGSISAGRFVASLLFTELQADLARPDSPANDLVVHAAGHKALGLYAMWALRNELLRAGAPDLLPSDETLELRLEDLLGFRRNPTHKTPLFRSLRSRALDGHPTPATPGVPIATGASGVGVPAALGLALAAIDVYGPEAAPRVHIIEGEGGMTPGRISEALAAGATAGLANAVLHIDWNQASIDSDHVCREGQEAGDYVQWTPAELAYLHDWNVLWVEDGRNHRQILAALALARTITNGQPTAIVYRTTKGWRYGIEGRGSHGAGHKFCSDGYYASLAECEQAFGVRFPRHQGDTSPAAVERTYWDTLLVFRQLFAGAEFPRRLAMRMRANRDALVRRGRIPRPDRPTLEPLYRDGRLSPARVPEELVLKPGSETTLRGALGDALGVLNRITHGGVIAAAADLLGSTSISNLGKGFPAGFYHATRNPGARLLACGGICEDAMGAFMCGLSSAGSHIGVGSSYAAFIAALEHVAARLHGIGQQARRDRDGEPFRTFVMVCAHAGLKTGEDGPTHADPQALQLLQENFPPGICITLTPWEPQEVWPLLAAGLMARPAVLAPFVTRPNEKVPDREALGLPPANAAALGVYALATADPTAEDYQGSLVIQESGVAYAFVDEVLPRLRADGMRMNIYLVTSPGLFDLLPAHERRLIFPPERAAEAMGITGFTLPTLYRWVTSEEGRAMSLHAFSRGRYPGSGQASQVLGECGLDGEAQLAAIHRYARAFSARRRRPCKV